MNTIRALLLVMGLMTLATPSIAAESDLISYTMPAIAFKDLLKVYSSFSGVPVKLASDVSSNTTLNLGHERGLTKAEAMRKVQKALRDQHNLEIRRVDGTDVIQPVPGKSRPE